MRTVVLAALTFAALPIGRAAQLLPTVATGLVTGRVIDADASGPIAGVIVTITGGPGGPPPGGFIPAGLTTASALTDSQGRFVFRGLPQGSFNLTTSVGGSGYSVSGFMATGLGSQIGPYLNGGYGQRRPG